MSDTEVQQWQEQQMQMAQFQQLISKFSEVCWDKCMTDTPPGASLSSNQNTCLTNCVNRYYDTNLFVTTRLQQANGKK
jgi:import inner membrane translocase subunit TIM8